MDPFRYELQEESSERLSIVLHGTLVGSSLAGLDAAVKEVLDRRSSGGRVVVDLTRVAKCDPAACRSLARLQRRLMAHRCRTAWLANRPRLRGAAWWIVHAAGDRQASPVSDSRFADDWLSGSTDRYDLLEANTRDAIDRAEHKLKASARGGR